MKSLKLVNVKLVNVMSRAKHIAGAGIAIALVFGCVQNLRAQYFSLHDRDLSKKVIDADGLDSVLFIASTPFALPRTNDSIGLTYHEPMPDSIMPRSAIVVGTITIQDEDPSELVTKLEKFARKSGADWIVSFAEPRAFHDKKGNRIFRASATLLHVLDPMFMNQNDLTYSYFETNNLHNYAEVTNWYASFGGHLGARIDKSE